jgi:hypothetical protein
MQVFKIKVNKDGDVETKPGTLRVPAHHNEDFVYTIHPKNEDDYDLEAIEIIEDDAFTQKRVNRKTILMHDDNLTHWKEGDTEYKYTVKVKSVKGGDLLEEDPTIVNQ